MHVIEVIILLICQKKWKLVTFLLNSPGLIDLVAMEMISEARWDIVMMIFLILFTGLFMHLGYSITEQHLLETESSMSLEKGRLSFKLAALLNQDSAQQVKHTKVGLSSFVMIDDIEI